MTKKLMLTAMAVMSVATVKSDAAKVFYKSLNGLYRPGLTNVEKKAIAFLNTLESAQNTFRPYRGRTLAAGSGMLGSGWLANAIYTDMNKPAVTKMDKVKNALSSAKNYVVDSRLSQLVANNPKTAIAAVSATALAGIGAYVAKNFEFGSEVEAKTAPKAEAKTAPVASKKTLTPAQKFKLRSQGIKC